MVYATFVVTKEVDLAIHMKERKTRKRGSKSVL